VVFGARPRRFKYNTNRVVQVPHEMDDNDVVDAGEGDVVSDLVDAYDEKWGLGRSQWFCIKLASGVRCQTKAVQIKLLYLRLSQLANDDNRSNPTTNCGLCGLVVSQLDCCSGVKVFKSQSRPIKTFFNSNECYYC